MRRYAWNAVFVGYSIAIAAPVSAGEGEASFTPTSLYSPLHSMVLMNSMTNQGVELYRCASDPDPSIPPAAGGGGMSGGGDSGNGGASGSAGMLSTVADDSDAGTNPEVLNGDCLIDMADNATLESLFSKPIDIRPGTYDMITFFLCDPGAQGYSSFVKGKVELSGTTYYTTSGAGSVLTTARADNRHVQVDFAGCASSLPLPKAVTVAANEAVHISAFFSLRNITWATLTGNGPGGCSFDTAHTQSVCAAYPIPIAYLGAESPAIDTYYITEDPMDLDAVKAGGQLLLLRSGTGTAFGGFSRRLFRSTSVNPSVNYDTPIKSIMLNPDATTYLIETFGGGGPGGVAIPYYIHFSNFELETHNGTLLRGDTMGEVPYRAVLQPPMH